MQDTTAMLGVFLVIPLVVVIGGLVFLLLRIARSKKANDITTRVYRLEQKNGENAYADGRGEDPMDDFDRRATGRPSFVRCAFSDGNHALDDAIELHACVHA
jgi:hypothetical protein